MAELLVKAVDHINPDPVKDLRGAYKRGMIVVVMPDGHVWGAKERPPLFVVVRLPGVDPALIKNYLEGVTIEDGIRGDGLPRLVPTRRRLWIIDLNLLPSPRLTALNRDGVLTVRTSRGGETRDMAWEDFRALIRNQETDTREGRDL